MTKPKNFLRLLDIRRTIAARLSAIDDGITWTFSEDTHSVILRGMPYIVARIPVHVFSPAVVREIHQTFFLLFGDVETPIIGMVTRKLERPRPTMQPVPVLYREIIMKVFWDPRP